MAVEVLFYNRNNPSRVIFSKFMSSPPRIGERMSVLINPTDDRSIVQYIIDEVITVVTSYESGRPESKIVFLREDNQANMTIDQA
jgi:hypothetical protein